MAAATTALPGPPELPRQTSLYTERTVEGSENSGKKGDPLPSTVASRRDRRQLASHSRSWRRNALQPLIIGGRRILSDGDVTSKSRSKPSECQQP